MKKNKQVAPQPLETKKSFFSVIVDGLFYLITIGIIVSALVFSFSKSTDKSVMGFRFLGVLTNSMAPNQQDNHADSFEVGDLLITQDIPGDEAEVGDIITYHPSIGSEVFLTHRVIKKFDEFNGQPGRYYITKGDNNTAEDLPISAEQVVAKKRVIIPKVGLIIKFVQENLVISLVFISAVIGFIWMLKSFFNKREN